MLMLVYIAKNAEIETDVIEGVRMLEYKCVFKTDVYVTMANILEAIYI